MVVSASACFLRISQRIPPVCLVKDENLELLHPDDVLASSKEELVDAAGGSNDDIGFGLEETRHILGGG